MDRRSPQHGRMEARLPKSQQNIPGKNCRERALDGAATEGIVFDIREFSVHDGPGVRTCVFLKGCPLRCAWCHNPEGQEYEPQEMRSVAGGARLVGQRWKSFKLAEHLNRHREMLCTIGGGITFTGGEPLAQGDFLLEVIRLLEGLHITIETSGQASADIFERVLEHCDMVYFDLKLVDGKLHRHYTGAGNEIILGNFEKLRRSNVPFVARVPLVPCVTDTEENLEAIACLLEGCGNLVRVDLLPYNMSAGGKYAACGKQFTPSWDESRPCRGNVSPFLHHGIYARVS